MLRLNDRAPKHPGLVLGQRDRVHSIPAKQTHHLIIVEPTDLHNKIGPKAEPCRDHPSDSGTLLRSDLGGAGGDGLSAAATARPGRSGGR